MEQIGMRPTHIIMVEKDASTTVTACYTADLNQLHKFGAIA